MTTIMSQCAACKHFKSDNTERESCAAFAAIPEEILSNRVDHSKLYDGDGGIQFEAADGFEDFSLSEVDE